MSRILVAEDSLVQARNIEQMLLTAGFQVTCVNNGLEALASVSSDLPDAILTDLQMPQMDGLELVDAVHRQYPSLPVVLMTAYGSEGLAVQALHRGATSYVPKRRLTQDLISTVRDVLTISASENRQAAVPTVAAPHFESNFVFGNDPENMPPLVEYVRGVLARIKFGEESELLRMGIAIHEAVINAMHHGNLEVSSSLREGDGLEYEELIQRRRSEKPYCDRRVRISATISDNEFVLTVTDEGPGFNPADLPDPTDPGNLEKHSGRGLLLIRTFMDEVFHNARGNQITLIKRQRSVQS